MPYWFWWCLVFRKKDLYLIITQKLTFHEIRRFSYGFHEIQWISGEIWWISWNPWNPADFTMKSGGFQVKSTPNLIKSDVWAKTLLMFQQKLFWFYKVWVDFTWNPPDFMKSARFHLKSTGFHEIHWISYGFHEIRWISCEIERPLQGIVTLCFVTVVGSFQLKILSVRQGTQHFTNENKVSRKWSDSVHLLTS